MNETNYLLAAISALVGLAGIQLKISFYLYKKAEARGDLIIELAKQMLKGEFCEKCKKNI